MSTKYKILIMGASYGSLLGTKLALAGHTTHLICLPAEADLINTEGAIVRMPVKGREGLVEIRSRKLPGKLSAGGPPASIPPTTIWWRSRCRSRSTARPACANCSTRSPSPECPACRS